MWSNTVCCHGAMARAGLPPRSTCAPLLSEPPQQPSHAGLLGWVRPTRGTRTVCPPSTLLFPSQCPHPLHLIIEFSIYHSLNFEILVLPGVFAPSQHIRLNKQALFRRPNSASAVQNQTPKPRSCRALRCCPFAHHLPANTALRASHVPAALAAAAVAPRLRVVALQPLGPFVWPALVPDPVLPHLSFGKRPKATPRLPRLCTHWAQGERTSQHRLPFGQVVA